MTQKFYLRASTRYSSTYPTSGEKSTTEPVGGQTYGLSPATLDLLNPKGASATSAATTLPNSTSANNGTLGRWASGPLKAGTYGSGNWSIAIQTAESDANYNVFWRSASIYFWRPGTSSVVGFVIDSNTATGVEFGNAVANTRYGQVLTWAGANVTIQDGDILVFEAWTGGTPSMAGSGRTATIYYDGTVDVTAAYAGTDPASYINAPADIPQIDTLPLSVATVASSGVALGVSAAVSIALTPATVATSAVALTATAHTPLPLTSASVSSALVVPIEFDAASQGGLWDTAGTTTFAHTIGAGTGRLLVVIAAMEHVGGADYMVQSIKYDGIDLLQVTSRDQGQAYVEMWYLSDDTGPLPAAGTYNVVITWTGTGIVRYTGAAVSLRKAYAISEAQVSDGGSGTTLSSSINVVTDGAWVVDGVSSETSVTFTADADQVERADNNNGGSGSGMAVSTRGPARAGATHMGWTASGSMANAAWVIAAWRPDSTYNLLDITAAVSRALGVASVSVSAVALVLKFDQSVDLTPATVAVSGVALASSTAVSIDLSPATVAVSAVALTTTGAVSLALDPATVTVSAVALVVVADQTATLTSATVAVSAVALTVAAGGVSVALPVATVNVSAVALTPTGAVSLQLDPAVVDVDAVALALSLATDVALAPAVVATSAVQLALAAAVSAALSPAEVPTVAQALDVTPGATSAALSPAQTAVEAVGLGISGVGSDSIPVLPALAAVTAQPLGISAGAVTLVLSPAEVQASAGQLGIQTTVSLVLGAAVVAASAQPLGVSVSGAALALGVASVLVTAGQLGITVGLAPGVVAGGGVVSRATHDRGVTTSVTRRET